MTDRYTPIYDEGDWILDTKTGEYLHLEEACNTLNQQHEHLTLIAKAYQNFIQKLFQKGEE